MRFERTSKTLSIAMFAATLAVVGDAAPAKAGFFDQLFGGMAVPQPYVPPPAAYPAPDVYAPVAPTRRVRRHFVDAKPVRQKTTDLMRDVTLRPGDAVMTKNGLRVFEGDEGNRHVKADFVALNNADDLSRKERLQLAAADTTRNDPLGHATTLDTVASGRSAAISSPIVAGVKITDARGRIVRYIGP